MRVGLEVVRRPGEKFVGESLELEGASFEQKKQGLRTGGGIAIWMWRRRHSGDGSRNGEQWFIESVDEEFAGKFFETRRRIRSLARKIHKLNESTGQKSLGIERIIAIDRLILSGGLIELSAYAFFTPLPYCPIGLGSP